MKLRNVSTEKDLGVIIDKGNQIAGLIRKTMTFMDPSMFLMLFKALVCLHLEYAVALWIPHLMKRIVAIEKVQRRFLAFRTSTLKKIEVANVFQTI